MRRVVPILNPGESIYLCSQDLYAIVSLKEHLIYAGITSLSVPDVLDFISVPFHISYLSTSSTYSTPLV